MRVLDRKVWAERNSAREKIKSAFLASGLP